jgi:hypothetical protein
VLLSSASVLLLWLVCCACFGSPIVLVALDRLRLCGLHLSGWAQIRDVVHSF